MLELKDVCKRYGLERAVDGVSVSVNAGEFFSLLGPSGSGKTTLLRLLAGFEQLDSGAILLDGKPIQNEPPNVRAFNMVFQRYALFPHLDVRENIAFGLRVKGGLTEREITTRVDEALALVAMTGFEARNVTTLSGGQQQRIAIARAIVNRPRVLLLDEPLAALDLKLRQRMQIELRALQRRLGMTFLFVTHAQDEALALSDRVAVMNGGRLEQVGTPLAIYHEPKSTFVASFIGTTNRLPGHSLGRTEAFVFVRPEDISFSDAKSNHDSHRLEAVVRDVIFRGASREVVVDHEAVGQLIMLLPDQHDAPRIGTKVTLWVAASKVLSFAESGPH